MSQEYNEASAVLLASYCSLLSKSMNSVEREYLITRAARAELVGEWLGAVGQVTALDVGAWQAWQVTQDKFVCL